MIISKPISMNIVSATSSVLAGYMNNYSSNKAELTASTAAMITAMNPCEKSEGPSATFNQDFVIEIQDEDVSFEALTDRVFSFAWDARWELLGEELRSIQQGPNGRVVLRRLAQAQYVGNYLLFTVVSRIAAYSNHLRKLMNEAKENGGVDCEELERTKADCESGGASICRLLIDEAGAAVNTGSSSPTVLSVAIENRCKLVVQLLLDRGADNDARAKALYKACFTSEDDILLLLLQNGADTNFAGGNSVLTKAAMEGQTKVFERLLPLGIDTSRPDAFGRMASQVAQSAGHNEISQMITNAVRLSDSVNKHKVG